MSLKINIVKKHSDKKKYSDLKPGDVFNYGCNYMGAVGLKTCVGHVFLQSAYGCTTDTRHIKHISTDMPIEFLGRLTGMEVER